VSRTYAVDGLRGYAALIVIFHHMLMFDTWFAEASVSDEAIGGGQLRYLVYYSPLHFFVAGPEAVLLFFMISGFVLAGGNTLWHSAKMSYLLPRLLRLYLPIWGSLLLATALAFLRPVVNPGSLSWWYKSQTTVNPHYFNPPFNVNILSNFAVLTGTDWLNSSLWSMRVEIAFSILLFLVILVSRLKWFGIILTLVFAYGTISIPVLRDFSAYLPFFVTGAVLSTVKVSLNELQSKLLLVVGILITLSPWLMNFYGNWGQMHLLGSAPSISRLLIQFLGISSILVAALSGNFRILGPSPVSTYLASRSYSLYLTHAPVLTLITLWTVNLGSNQEKLWFWLPVTFMLIFLVAEACFRIVENPSRILSRKLKHRFSTLENEI
jgi:peptidoglycan/LPS O-acetylase OafA/YrhL